MKVDFNAIWTKIVEYACSTGIKLIVSVVLLIVVWKLINLILRKAEKSRAFQKIDITFRSFLHNLIGITLRIILIITLITYLGVPMTSILTIVASAGLAVGLALQGGLSNLAGGVMLVFFKPFKVGDFISAGNVSGTAIDLGVFYTTIRTPDNKKIFVPNSVLTGSTLTNYSCEATRRVDFEFKVAGDSDINMVREVLTAIANQYNLILKNPEPEIALTGISDGKITMAMRVWCESDNYGEVNSTVQEIVKAAFDKKGIVIPTAQLEVNIKNN